MDPLTIGLAFTAAQSAVSHIKQAIALGKDVRWTWYGDVYNRTVICLEWKKAGIRWIR